MRLLVLTQKVDANDPLLGFFHRWIAELAEHVEEVHVVCLEAGRYSLPGHVTVTSLGKELGASRVGYLGNFYRTVGPLLLSRRVDRVLVHMNEVYVLLLAPFLPIRRTRGIRLLWWKTHAQLSRRARVARFLVDAVVTASDESFPIETSKKVVVGHGIDTDLFAPGSEDSRDAEAILSVGRLSPVKHYEDAIAALPLLPDRTRLLIVGPDAGPSRAYPERLQALADRLGVAGRVMFEHSRPHEAMPEVYRSARVLVNTSDTDSIDKVVLEAMACGTLPVSSNSAFERLLAPRGLFVGKRDPEALAEVVRRTLELSEEERASLRQELRSHVVESHDLRNLARAILTV